MRQAACRPCGVRQIEHTPLPSAVPGFQARIFLQQRPPSPTMSLASNAGATAARTAHIRRSFVSSCAKERRDLSESEGWMSGGTSLLLAPPEPDDELGVECSRDCGAHGAHQAKLRFELLNLHNNGPDTRTPGTVSLRE